MALPVRLAVTGRPSAHSKSPQIFRKFLGSCGISGFYTRIASDSVEEAVAAADAAGITGINVTSPFKEQAAAFAGFRDEAVNILGASNTLVLDRECLDGSSRVSGGSSQGSACVKAYNTDYSGVYESAVRFFPEGRRGNAFVLGAGGAGVAAAYGLSLAGFKVTVFNRNTEKAAKSCAGIRGCSVLPLGKIEKMAPCADLIVNALPLGRGVFDPAALGEDNVVFDADYRNSPYHPGKTGGRYRYISGLTWLVHQAAHAFTIFTGLAPDEDLASQVTIEDIAAEGKNNVSLIGFMGSGKTTTGRHLARIMGYDFTDVDSEIEKAEGMGISAIFSEKGEDYFRQAEKRMTEKIFRSSRNMVISCGGGAVKDSGNREIIKSLSFPVWLASPPDVTSQRVRGGLRPLLDGKGIAEMQKLYSERIDYYGSTADLLIDSSVRGAAETAERINEEISYIFMRQG